jgi:hypothetical protein
MSGFEQLEQAIQQPVQTITANDVAFSDEDLTDEVALSIVLQDTDTAEKFMQSKSLLAGLDTADDLYRAFVKPRMWPNGKPRSNLSMPVVLECIEKVLPTLHLTLWGNGATPFNLIPKGRTSPLAARAKSHVLAWAVKQAGLKEEMRRTLKTVLQYGFVVGNWGWESKTKNVKRYVMEAGKVTRKRDTVEISQPTYKCLDLRKVLVDPACDTQDVRKSAKFVILQLSLTANDLDSLRDDPTYRNVPSREELALILANNHSGTIDSLAASKSNTYRDLQAEKDFQPTSVDPLQSPLEILEYHSDDRVIAVLNRMIVIRNEANEFDRKSQVSCAFIDVLGSAWGFGIAKLLSGEQRFQTGVRNSWVDSLALSLNPMFQLLKGIGTGTQQISASPGRVITESGELKPLITGSVTQEAVNAIGDSDERSHRLVGANGGSSMPSQALRTAQGIASFTGDVIQRLQYWLETFIDMVFVPVLEAFIEMCCDRLTPEQINQILVDAEGKAFQGSILDVYNAQCDVEVLAGTKLTARQAAAQLVPMIVTLLSNTAVQDSLVIQNKKFDYEELLEETLDLMGWDVNSLIVEMTEEDQQRAQMMNPQAIKGQMDQQLEAQKQQNTLQQIEQKGFVQAGVAVVRQGIKSHLDDASSALESMQNPMQGAVAPGQGA